MCTYLRNVSFDFGPPIPFLECLSFFRTTAACFLIQGSRELTFGASQFSLISRAEGAIEEIRGGHNLVQSNVGDTVGVNVQAVGSNQKENPARPTGTKRAKELARTH